MGNLRHCQLCRPDRNRDGLLSLSYRFDGDFSLSTSEILRKLEHHTDQKKAKLFSVISCEYADFVVADMTAQ